MSYHVPGLTHPHFTLVDLEQGSDAWLDWRKTGLGSSDAAAILGESPWKTRRDLWEEKVVEYHGARAPLSGAQFQAIRRAMAAREAQNDTAKNRGKKLEPVVRAEVEELLGLAFETACGYHAEREYLKVSLDGWHAPAFLEIKAPNQKAHGDALDGVVPTYYRSQLLHQFLVTGARAGWYASAHPKYPPGQRLALVAVTPETAEATLNYDGQYAGGLADLVATLGAVEADFWAAVVSGRYREIGE